MTPRLPELSAEDILAALNARGVRYLVIGAFSAIAQGAPIEATYDVDLTPQRDPENLERLSLALDDLQARVRVDQLDEGLPFSHDARSLAGIDMLNLTCPAGDFDLVFAPAGYDELAPRSVMITVGDQTCARQAWATSCTPKKKPAARKTYEPCLFPPIPARPSRRPFRSRRRPGFMTSVQSTTHHRGYSEQSRDSAQSAGRPNWRVLGSIVVR